MTRGAALGNLLMSMATYTMVNGKHMSGMAWVHTSTRTLDQDMLVYGKMELEMVMVNSFTVGTNSLENFTRIRYVQLAFSRQLHNLF